MDSPLAKIQLPNKFSTSPKLEIPEFIRLPSGEQVSTRELLKQRSRSQTIDLRTGRPGHVPKARKPRHTYTFDERVWMATAEARDIADRFGIRIGCARDLKEQCQNLMIYMANAEQTNERNS